MLMLINISQDSKMQGIKNTWRVPSLQQIAIMSIIEREDIIAILNPEEDWDDDNSHLFNQRLTRHEYLDFQIQAMSGERSLTQIKADMRDLLQQRPFDLDLVQLRKLPPFHWIPKIVSKQIWIEAFLTFFEAKLPKLLNFNLCHGPIVMNWLLLGCLLDGCEDSNLLKMLRDHEQRLINRYIDDFTLQWLLDNLTIDE